MCTHYLAKYIDNEAIAVKLEDLINNKNNSSIKPSDYIVKYENRILSMFNSMLDKGQNMEDIYDYVAKNPSKKLWKTLSQRAMENLDFDTAHKSMLQMNDFDGLDFLKQVKNIDDPEVQKAEIAQYNSQYDEASKLFAKNGRNDLNLAMLMKLGKWDKV
jgi:WD repeat-containing protein 35